MTKDYNLKNPATQVAWLAGIKDKIFNATGIPPYKLDILTMHVSKTEKVKLAWLTFGSKIIVVKIFRLTQLNGSGKLFNAFPHIPAKPLKQKEAIEAILKRLQKINCPLRYQLRLREMI